MDKKLSVIISNRNDVAMLVVTIRSCIEEFQALPPNSCEVVVADNSDPIIYERLAGALPTGYSRGKDRILKVARQEEPCLFTARELAARTASGEYILCLDSHMLCGHNMIRDLVSFMDSKSNDSTLGFAHAPISWAHQHERVARHDRDVSKHELGPWGTAYDHVRTITWKGMPWICRRKWFLENLRGYGALSEHKISWGGGDMHIGVKPWLLGFKNWAVPCRPAIHIGPFPKTDVDSKGKWDYGSKAGESEDARKQKQRDRYRLYSNSGNGPHAIGFLVSCYVLGGEKMMNRNKDALKERFGRYINIEKWWHKAMEWGANEKRWLDEVKVMTFEEFVSSKPWENGTGNS